MPASDILVKLKHILELPASRREKAREIAEAIRASGPYRWVGIYDVNIKECLVFNIAWSGPSAPAFPTFPVTKGITSRAIATKQIVNVGDVTDDSDYLTALGNTQSEIIVPVLDATAQQVVGTIDVESEKRDAFGKDAEGLLGKCAELLRPFWKDGRYDHLSQTSGT